MSSTAANKQEDGRSAAERECGAQACAIQYCLQRHGYQPKPCEPVVAEYRRCVEAAMEKAGSGGGSGVKQQSSSPASAGPGR